ncbi:amino acid ABC transporter permease [Pseudodesulfovibrio indicus]|uniref:amino acid ABC transporter permease n=1 Tax=Pseudodesulfovibrio indicus TaxID=1716143 RepID=UPI00292D5735|nr:amino acid ABC transporter permease [Pseudodesulfovibrio indicus]
MNASLDYTVVIDNLPLLIQGAGVTLAVALASITAGLAVGMAVCLGRLSGNRVLSGLMKVYISALRGIPILVMLMIVFYMLPLVGLEVPPVLAAILGLSLNSAAFQAEIFRGGFNSLPKGQLEAARALGMAETRILTRIVIPQVLLRVLPSLVNELIVLLKNTSLASTITVIELLRTSQQLVSSTYRPTEIYSAAALLYILMCFGLSALGSTVRNRLSGHGEGVA